MKSYDVIVVGGGPAGLGAAIKAAEYGASCLLIDENGRPGGQLFKQIHKFFGSREHYAGYRGYEIGELLLRQAAELQVDIRLNTHVWGVFKGNIVTACGEKGQALSFHGKKVVLATGASENTLAFPGNGLPGVITAGAAQTFVNIHGVKPGNRAVVVGSGNVGLIVSYQMKQAGMDVPAIIEALGAVNGYEVHAAKVRRRGTSIHLRHTVVRALGENELEAVVIGGVDEQFRPLPGTEKTIAADTLCLAVGLSPRVELAALAGCGLCYNPVLGGSLPLHGPSMQSTQRDIFVAGDLAGVEEASTALDEGRIAGLAAVEALGKAETGGLGEEQAQAARRLSLLRQGPFGAKRQRAKEDVMAALRAAPL